MAAVPHSWKAYARLQRRLAKTTSIATAAALEAALNVVHSADFKPEDLTDDGLERAAATAGRRERDHLRLLRHYAAAEESGHCATRKESKGPAVDVQPQSLDDAVHASRELSRLKTMMPAPDWELLVGVGVGASYEELAVQLATRSAALRSRVCRLRQVIM
jgi:hypothetical protein